MAALPTPAVPWQGDGSETDEATLAEINIAEAMLGIHTARFRRDNLSDVWHALDQLAEQVRTVAVVSGAAIPDS